MGFENAGLDIDGQDIGIERHQNKLLLASVTDLPSRVAIIGQWIYSPAMHPAEDTSYQHRVTTITIWLSRQRDNVSNFGVCSCRCSQRRRLRSLSGGIMLVMCGHVRLWENCALTVADMAAGFPVCLRTSPWLRGCRWVIKV